MPANSTRSNGPIWGTFMKKAVCLMILASALPVSAWAACDYPRAPGKLPDGTSSTKEEMLAAKKTVDSYQELMNKYLACLKDDFDKTMKGPGAESMTSEQKKEVSDRYTAKNDAAVDEMQDVAGRFNEQVRAYKAKSAK